MRRLIDITGNKVILALYEHSGLSWVELCNSLGFDTNDGARMGLYFCLISLFEAGLITVDEIEESEFFEFIKMALSKKDEGQIIRTSDKWRKIQMALHMKYHVGSAFQPESMTSKYSMTVYPQFGTPPISTFHTDIFVVMPFSNQFLPIYTDHIAQIGQDLGFIVRRADDFFTNNHVILDVWSAICSASAIIADCTGRNPNVFYEIGIAHTIGKPVILITQDSDDIPIDLRHIKYIKYDYTPTGMSSFKISLFKTLQEVLGLKEPR
jgi:hypothetical protein